MHAASVDVIAKHRLLHPCTPATGHVSRNVLLCCCAPVSLLDIPVSLDAALIAAAAAVLLPG